jgi:hypothetical protein
VIDGKERQVSTHLTPEQARAVPVAKDLHDGPVVKQLLEWIAELESRQSEKK